MTTVHRRCDVCRDAQAMMSCSMCGEVLCCFVCGVRRHQHGNLRHHQFRFVLEEEPASGASSSQIKCQWCSVESAVIQCPHCDMRFCRSCASKFHDVGAGTMSSHEADYKYVAPRPQPLLKPQQQQMPPDSPFSPKSPVNAASLLPTYSLRGLDDAATSSTFKLASYGLGVSDSRLLESAANEKKVRYFINIDYQKHVVSVFGKKDEHVVLAHNRAFRSMKQTVTNTVDPRHFSIYFNDSKPVAQCLAMNREEGVQIREQLEQICSKERCQRLLLSSPPRQQLQQDQYETSPMTEAASRLAVVDSRIVEDDSTEPAPATGHQQQLGLSVDVESPMASIDMLGSPVAGGGDDIAREDDEKLLFSGPCLKRGRMRWGARWMVIRDRELLLYKSSESTVPTHVVALGSGTRVESVTKKDKHVVVHGPTRKFLLKFGSKAERDTIVSLLEKNADVVPGVTSLTTTTTTTTKPSPYGNDNSLLGDTRLPLRRPSLFETDDESDLEDLTFDDVPAGSSTPAATGASGGGGGGGSGTGVGVGMMARGESMDQLDVLDDALTPVETRRELADRYTHVLQQQMRFTPARPKRFQNLMDSMGARGSGPKVDFFEEDIGKCEFLPPPAVITKGVYRLMTMLLQSMESGAMLSPLIFVPRTIWLQKSAKVQAYLAKVEAFEVLQQTMLHLDPGMVNEDGDKFESHLIKFRAVTEDLQNKLAQHLSYVHSVKTSSALEDKQRGFTEKLVSTLKKKMHRGVSAAAKDTVSDTTRYVRLLASVLRLSLLFEPWVHRAMQPSAPYGESVQEHLRCISEFFHAVVCNVVLHDMKTVLKRYMKHASRVIIGDHQ